LERVPIFRFHVRLAAILGSGTFMDSFDALAIAVTLPIIVSSFALSTGDIGLLISAAYVGQLVGSLLFGWIAEQAGRRPAVIGTFVVMGVFSLAAAASWDAGSLALARVLTGIGLGGEVPVAAALFNEFVGARRRGLITMAYESTFVWGFLITPLVGLALVSALGPEVGWRAVFVLGGLSLVTAAIAWRLLPESVRWLVRSGRIDEADTTLARIEEEARARGVELAVPEPQHQPDVGPTRWREPLEGAFRQRTILLWTLAFTDFFATYGYAIWLPTLYVTIGGLPPTASLALTAVTGVLQLVAAYLFAGTLDRAGRRMWFLFGFGLAALSAIAGALASTLGYTSWPTLFLVGVGILFGLTPVSMGIYLYAGELYPTRMRAWGTGLAASWIRIAAIVAPIAVAAVLSAGFGIAAIFMMFAVATTMGFLVMYRLGPETRRKVLEEIAT
jgi:MFS transporter, putative metabolite:H+ symporter